MSVDLIDQGISALRARRSELAESALQSPSGRDTFEYGRVCGIYKGLEMAEDTLIQTKRDSAKAEALI